MMSDEHRCQIWRTVVRLILSGHYLHPPAAATQYCAGGCVTRDTLNPATFVPDCVLDILC